MSEDYGFYAKAAAGKPEPTTEGGASGYFDAPAATLDPALFQGDKMHWEVRDWIWGTIYDWFAQWHLADINRWLHIWVAGSGVTYQWAGDRGNGDLDVLLGVDWPVFTQDNPGWAEQYREEEMAQQVNEGLKNGLWPKTARKLFRAKPFEVTFYWNPGTGTDIRNIGAYAAYNVKTNRFDVSPPELPQDPGKLYSPDWYQAAQADATKAQELTERYNFLQRDLGAAQEGSAGWHNAGAKLHLVISQAQSMLEDIHNGRRAAFQGGGKGYGDWHNFRWQEAKKNGVVKSLAGIVDVSREAMAASNQSLYGTEHIADANEALLRATMVHQNRRFKL